MTNVATPQPQATSGSNPTPKEAGTAAMIQVWLKMMAAPIQVSGSSLDVGSPVALFQTRVANVPIQEYAVSADGRFLVNQYVEESTTTPITLILNWKPKTQ